MIGMLPSGIGAGPTGVDGGIGAEVGVGGSADEGIGSGVGVGCSGAGAGVVGLAGAGAIRDGAGVVAGGAFSVSGGKTPQLLVSRKKQITNMVKTDSLFIAFSVFSWRE
ncbi:hypothetical protein ACFLTR_00880 [Chloroflexota bacterium]